MGVNVAAISGIEQSLMAMIAMPGQVSSQPECQNLTRFQDLMDAFLPDTSGTGPGNVAQASPNPQSALLTMLPAANLNAPPVTNIFTDAAPKGFSPGGIAPTVSAPPVKALLAGPPALALRAAARIEPCPKNVQKQQPAALPIRIDPRTAPLPAIAPIQPAAHANAPKYNNAPPPPDGPTIRAATVEATVHATQSASLAFALNLAPKQIVEIMATRQTAAPQTEPETDTEPESLPEAQGKPHSAEKIEPALSIKKDPEPKTKPAAEQRIQPLSTEPSEAGLGEHAAPPAKTIAPQVIQPPQAASLQSTEPAAPHAITTPVATALRTSEPGILASSMPASVPPRTSAVQEISMRIERPEAAAVDVHLMQRGGQVHVAVHTMDTGLQTSLRQDLGTLVSSLDRAGYRAEAIAPHESTQMNSQNGQQESQPGTKENPERRGGEQSQEQSQQQRERVLRNWMEVMENAQ